MDILSIVIFFLSYDLGFRTMSAHSLILLIGRLERYCFSCVFSVILLKTGCIEMLT
jgi:hypothetical protein